MRWSFLSMGDKEKSLITELELMTQEGYQWNGLKRVRKLFQSKRYKFKNKHGDPINEKEFSETAADYFADVQWAAPQDNYLHPDKENSPLIDGNSSMDDSPFTPHELDAVLKVLKNNKAPGPDGCRSEPIKWLSGINRLYLLELFNYIHINGIYPECFTLANIAALYKKGDATQMKNYRPIALLQVFYKILARLVRNRFQCAYDSWIQNSQFGFRPKKSTSQAHFVARRLLDIAERQQSNMTLVLLDWEKAFDKINQSKMLQVLRRLKTPPNMLRLVTHMYAHPKFRITTEGISSRYRRQESGIRQGCPLSPFLFILLMGALFHDLKSKLNTPKQLEPIKGIRYAEVLYADDMMILWFLGHIPNQSIFFCMQYSRNPYTTIWIWIMTNALTLRCTRNNLASNIWVERLSPENMKQYIWEPCSQIV